MPDESKANNLNENQSQADDFSPLKKGAKSNYTDGDVS